MSPAVEQLLQAALALPEADRADLLDALMATLEPETGAVLDDAWKAEVARRSAEYDAGLVKPIPWLEVKEGAGRESHRMADVVFLPAARHEYEEAHAWYLARSERAASGFEEMIERGLEHIGEAPERWPTYDDLHRHYLLKRYPYVLIYRIVSGQVLIVAVAHAKRRPGYWKDRE